MRWIKNYETERRISPSDTVNVQRAVPPPLSSVCWLVASLELAGLHSEPETKTLRLYHEYRNWANSINLNL